MVAGAGAAGRRWGGAAGHFFLSPCVVSGLLHEVSLHRLAWASSKDGILQPIMLLTRWLRAPGSVSSTSNSEVPVSFLWYPVGCNQVISLSLIKGRNVKVIFYEEHVGCNLLWKIQSSIDLQDELELNRGRREGRRF